MATTITDPNPTPDPDRPRLYQSQLKRLLQMTPADFVVLDLWLQGQERYIAAADHGVGMLSGVFKAIVGKDARAA